MNYSYYKKNCCALHAPNLLPQCLSQPSYVTEIKSQTENQHVDPIFYISSDHDSSLPNFQLQPVSEKFQSPSYCRNLIIKQPPVVTTYLLNF